MTKMVQQVHIVISNIHLDMNIQKDQYYSEENYDKWDEKYHLSKYNIPYKERQSKALDHV